MTTLILLLAISSAVAQNNHQTKFVTVCQVLGNRATYNGKVVALVGRWSPTDEGFWMADECQNPVKTGEYVWDSVIVLTYDPSSPSIFSNRPHLDRVAVNKKIAELKARSKSTNDNLEWAIVYGRIETKEDLSTASARDGSIRPAGYGHLAGAPAQIVYREKDIVILPRERR